MALFYKKTQRGNPANPSAPKLWYPILKSIGLVKEKQVAQQLADETTLNPKEAEMTLYQLLKVIVNLLLDGHTVQLGELGSFRLTSRSEGSATEEAVNPNKIKSVHVHFTPSKTLREQLGKATFRDMSKISG
ncbi:MAG: HU family DNA-binding protein [Dysgonamonadaceae bacterium]|jgi:predicted histone-like DNA-binding protein|nr:HU family DNA-binding protein [Dysgonamonadaceae bacterium]